MNEESKNSNSREFHQWLLRSAIAVAVFFGGKWVGRVDRLMENSPAGYERLAVVEQKAITVQESMGRLAKTQEVMLTNQLEMNQFIARQYGNKELADKFKEQLRVVKEEKQERYEQQP